MPFLYPKTTITHNQVKTNRYRRETRHTSQRQRLQLDVYNKDIIGNELINNGHNMIN